MATGTIKSQKAFITDAAGTQQSGTLNAGGATTVSVPYTLPSGYTAIGLQQLYVTGSNAVLYRWVLMRSTNTVSVAIRNVGTAAQNYTVDATVVCIKTS